MKVLSLCSGIGGFEIACEWAGMGIVGQVEIDPFCLRVLEKHWPKVRRIPDVKDVRGDEFGTVDIIVAGIPCQPYSVAGKRKGNKDDRAIWPEVSRIIQKARPAWCVIENVTGFVSLALDDALSDLESEGYETAAFVIPACAVGAPHRRDRVWILAHSAGTQRNAGAEEQRVLRRMPADGQECNNADGSSEAQPGKNVVGYAKREGLQRYDDFQKSALFTKPDKDVADTPCQLPYGSGDARARRWDKSSDSNWWEPQSGLGESVARISTTLDGGGIVGLSAYPNRREPCQQQSLEPDDVMRLLSHPMALAEWEKAIKEAIGLQNLRRACKEIGYVWETLPAFQEIWQPLPYKDKMWIAFRVSGRTPWPAPFGCEQYGWEPPRLVSGKVPYRRQKLQALGNAVVPQVAYVFFTAILVAEQQSAEKEQYPPLTRNIIRAKKVVVIGGGCD